MAEPSTTCQPSTASQPNTASQSSAATSGFWAELESLKPPAAKDVGPVPGVGSKAPSTPQLPLPDGRKTLLLFLLHFGCPFAEKTFRSLTAVSERHRDVHCVAVSHSYETATDQWVPRVGGTWHADVVDQSRDFYAKWGLGLSSTWGMLNPLSLYSLYRLGADEGIWNKPTESGSRWQTSGAFAVDGDGIVRWAHVSSTADDLPDFHATLEALRA